MSDIENLAKRYTQLAAQIDALREEMGVINTVLASYGYGTHPAGDLRVQIQHNRRLDAAKVQAAYPVVSRPELYKPSLDTAAIKQHIAPTELEQFYIDGAPKVVVR